TSSPPRRRTRRPSSRVGGRNPPPKRSRMRAITFSLLVTAACGTLATGTYFVFRDDLFTRLIGHQTQTQISYEDQIGCRCQTRSALLHTPHTPTTYGPRSSRQQRCSMSTCG